MKKFILISWLLLLAASTSFAQIVDDAQPDFKPTIQTAIERQLTTYPESTLQDIYKSFYQEHFGPGHIISDTASARRYLMRELSEMGKTQSPYFEPTGSQGDYVRVYLSAVADSLITAEQLLDAFVRSANSRQEPAVSWLEKWEAIVSIIQANKMELEGFEPNLPLLTEAARNNQAVHHSRRYNEAYRPHYRIVERSIFEIELKPSLK